MLVDVQFSGASGINLLVEVGKGLCNGGIGQKLLR